MYAQAATRRTMNSAIGTLHQTTSNSCGLRYDRPTRFRRGGASTQDWVSPTSTTRRAAGER